MTLYRFPQMCDLPDEFDGTMFRQKGMLYPGTVFDATDTGEFHELMFFKRGHEGNWATMKDVVKVKCKRVE